MDVKMSVYDVATGGVATKSTKESVNSQMPGRENGPADAYRRILLSAELTRRYGNGNDRLFGQKKKCTN